MSLIRGDVIFFSRPSGQTYTDRGLVESFDYVFEDFTCNSNWYELDLSSIIGKGKKLVLINLGLVATKTTHGLFLRTHSQEDTKNFGGITVTVSGVYRENLVTVYSDKDGKIDYFGQSSITLIQFVIRGWFS